MATSRMVSSDRHSCGGDRLFSDLDPDQTDENNELYSTVFVVEEKIKMSRLTTSSSSSSSMAPKTPTPTAKTSKPSLSLLPFHCCRSKTNTRHRCHRTAIVWWPFPAMVMMIIFTGSVRLGGATENITTIRTVDNQTKIFDNNDPKNGDLEKHGTTTTTIGFDRKFDISEDADDDASMALVSSTEPIDSIERNNDDDDDEGYEEGDDDEEDDQEEYTGSGGDKSKKRKIKSNNNNNDYDDDDDDSGRGGRMASNVCTAGYFFDRIIPEDYPHEISKDVKHINETIERLNRMYAFSNKMMERLSPFIREMVSRMTDYIYESQLDAECMGALFRVFRAINQRKPWAMSFLDASGSVFVGGFQQGMFVSLGEFDQCLEIESDPLDNNNLIYGQYCLLKPVVPLPEDGTIQQGEPIAQSRIPRVNKFLNDEYIDTYLGLYKFMKRTFLRVGLCLPHLCERQSLENAINRILVRKTGMSVQVGPECVKATDQVPLSIVQIISMIIFGSLLTLVLLSTGYEIIYRHVFENRNTLTLAPVTSTVTLERSISTGSRQYFDKPVMVQALTAFSIIRNTRHLFDHPLQPTRYPQLDTMRLLLTLFFFITNAYYYTLVFAPMIIKRFYVQGPMQFLSEKKYFFIRMYYLIDCFVVFSGIALTLSFHRGTFSYLPYVVRMYIRYTLPILVSIGLIFVAPLFGDGPLWHLFDQTMTQPCRENFWSTLLFYNNFHTNIEEICNLPTVFVSMTFQLKLFAPVILMVNSHMAPKMGTMFLLLLLLASFIANLFYRFYYDYKIPYEFWMMKSFSEMKESVMFYFFNPFCHISPLIIGLLVGHLIMTGPQEPGSTIRTGITGFFCMSAFLASFVWIENLDLLKPQISTEQLVVMLTVGRAMLVAMHAWIIYASIRGHITIVNRFLSSIAFRPLSQLSYGFYLTSIIVTCYRLFSIRQTIILSGQTMFRAIVSDAVISFLFAYLIHIMVQQPVRNLLHIRALWPCADKDEHDDDDDRGDQPAVYFVRSYSQEKFQTKTIDSNNNCHRKNHQTTTFQSESISMVDEKSVMLHLSDHNNQKSEIS